VEFIYNKWTLRKRYSDFEDLHKSLKITYNHLPGLPGKSLFALKKDADIDKRRLGLDVYIKELVKRADVYADPHFAKFLEVRSWISRGLSIVGRASTRYDNKSNADGR